jgi:hypothetical protein
LYKEKPELVIPEFRFNESKAFLDRGLEDFSISRLKSKMSWWEKERKEEDMREWYFLCTEEEFLYTGYTRETVLIQGYSGGV